jgi:hypothetical protein
MATVGSQFIGDLRRQACLSWRSQTVVALAPMKLGSYPLPEFDLAQVPAHTQARLRDRLDVRRRPARGCFFQ